MSRCDTSPHPRAQVLDDLGLEGHVLDRLSEEKPDEVARFVSRERHLGCTGLPSDWGRQYVPPPLVMSSAGFSLLRRLLHIDESE